MEKWDILNIANVYNFFQQATQNQLGWGCPSNFQDQYGQIHGPCWYPFLLLCIRTPLHTWLQSQCLQIAPPTGSPELGLGIDLFTCTSSEVASDLRLQVFPCNTPHEKMKARKQVLDFQQVNQSTGPEEWPIQTPTSSCCGGCIKVKICIRKTSIYKTDPWASSGRTRPATKQQDEHRSNDPRKKV